MDLTFCDQSFNNIKLNSDTKIKIVACEGRNDKKVSRFAFLNIFSYFKIKNL